MNAKTRKIFGEYNLKYDKSANSIYASCGVILFQVERKKRTTIWTRYFYGPSYEQHIFKFL